LVDGFTMAALAALNAALAVAGADPVLVPEALPVALAVPLGLPLVLVVLLLPLLHADSRVTLAATAPTATVHLEYFLIRSFRPSLCG